MFDIGADELLLTAVVAVVVIGPKDLPRALRTVGRWVAKMRRMSNAFRAGVESVIREAEMEELEKEWRARNAATMTEHPDHDADSDARAAAAGALGHMPDAPAAEVHPPVVEHPPAVEPGPPTREGPP